MSKTDNDDTTPHYVDASAEAGDIPAADKVENSDVEPVNPGPPAPSENNATVGEHHVADAEPAKSPPPAPPVPPTVGSSQHPQTSPMSLDKEVAPELGKGSTEHPEPPRNPYYVALEEQDGKPWREAEQQFRGGSNFQGANPPPPPPYTNPQPHMPPAPMKPKNLETAYAYLLFLGLFGGHKFYMGQNTLGNIYLVIGLVFVVFLGLPIIGSFFGFFVFLGLMANLYADVRTMREQLERSSRGEEFTIDTQMEFFSKAFSQK